MKPLAIDLFCGLGGWTEGLLAEGYEVVGFDIEQHIYGEHQYPAQLVVQDVTTLHGSQFRGAALIVASPPCQEYSYMAMPWSLAKAKAAAIHADTTGQALADLNRLFDACFRIQREACEAAGRHIPMIVENVRGAQPWVGRARWGYGSFMLWGDVPALMPITAKAIKVPTMGAGWYPPDHPKHVRDLGFNTHADHNLREGMKVPGFRFDGSGKSFQSASVEQTGVKVAGMNWSGYGKPGYVAKGFNTTADQRVREGAKNNGGSWFNVARNTKSGKGQNPDGRKTSGHPNIRDGNPCTKHLTNPAEHQAVAADLGTMIGGDWFSDPQSTCRKHGSKSKGRKMASAMIAKIPLPLSRHVARTYFPRNV